MIVYVAVDNNMGIMFNNRRQSQDRILRNDLLNDCKNTRLWMNTYTHTLFDTTEQVNIIVDEDFLQMAATDDNCYVETNSLQGYENRISKLVLYRWNRDYPADLYLDIALSNWTMIETTDFVGSSHEKITKEVWVHNENSQK